MLAGVSPSYYTRLEQGHSRHASDEVLSALATALRLDADERAHLRDLATTTRRPPAARRPPAEHVEPALLGLVAALGDTPALVLGRRTDVLAWNPAGHALLGLGVDLRAVEDPKTRPNMTELVFLDDNQRHLYADWAAKARAVVGNLRVVVGRYPDDEALATLVGTLSIKSPEFARLWSDHRVLPCGTADYRLDHPLIGSLVVTQHSLRYLESPDQVLVTCTAESHSSSAHALTLLAQMIGGPAEDPVHRAPVTST